MYAVLHVPYFRLQAALRPQETASNVPVALVDGAEKKSVVLEMNAEAARRGVRPEMPIPQALARCSDLTVILRAPDQEQLANTVLLQVAGSLSPEIEATASGVCTLHLRLPDNHDWEAMGKRAVSLLEAQNLHATAGLAPNPDLAFLAAHRASPVLVVLSDAGEPECRISEPEHRNSGLEVRHKLVGVRNPPVRSPDEMPPADQNPTEQKRVPVLAVHEASAFLDNLPVAALNPPPEFLTLLRDWGIRTLRELRSLPRGDFMDRLGPEAGRLWELASGSASRPLRLITPPVEFIENFDFEYEVETTEPLLFILRRFLDRLTARMRGIWRVAGSMKIILRLEDDSCYERLFTIPEPAANPEVLFRILNTHLESLTLPRRPVGLSLQLEPVAVSRDQLQLFESALRDPNGLGETLARLAALTGPENAGVISRQDTHQPDQWIVAAPRFHQMPAHTHPDTSSPAIGLPLQRLRPPHRATVRLKQHRPETVESPEASGPVVSALGPYGLSGRWWDRIAAWAQEEWDVELENGSLLRLTRHAGGWLVSGYYELESAEAV